MPRENSLSDSEGRSLTPDLEDEEMAERRAASSMAISPRQRHHRTPGGGAHHLQLIRTRTASKRSVHSQASRQSAAASIPSAWQQLPPLDRFRSLARRVIALRRGTLMFEGFMTSRVGAEPGVNPRRPTAEALYGNIHKECVIEVSDYSSIRSNFRKMSNAEFVDLMDNDITGQREPWVKVRWINIGGLSWDVIKAVAIKYGGFYFLPPSRHA